MPQLIIVAHSPMATALREVALHTYAEAQGQVLALDVLPDDSQESVEGRLRALMVPGDEHLLLADVFGATPCNAALRTADGVTSRVVSGVNTPMLWRALCYRGEPLAKLVGIAVSGGTHGIMQLASTRPQNQSNKGSPDDPVDSQDQ